MITRKHRAPAIILASTLFLNACSNSEEPLDRILSEEADPVIWRFALEEISGSVQDAWAQEFRQRLQTVSDGEIQVEIYPYGSIGTSPELTSLIREGRVQLGFASPGHLATSIPEAGIFVLPFLFPEDTTRNNEALGDPELNELLGEAWQEHKLHLLDIVPEGWMVWTSDRELRSPADFEGLRMRTMTAPLLSDIYRSYGAEPVPLPYSEVYSALQTEQIDGQTNPVFAVLEMKFYELQSVLTQPRATRFVSTVVANEAWYRNLNEDHRRWLQEAREGMPEFIDEVQQEYNSERLEQLRATGAIEITALTDEQRDAFRQAGQEAHGHYIEQAGKRGRNILERVLRLTDDVP